ncbi:glycosyltransferase [Terricaulis sp.]|uniref:glycosyltransferase n=1 Tax=Terricaulis sp. TaxID=2768686 RepID=UPI0037851D9E
MGMGDGDGRPDGARPVAAEVDAATLERACFELERAQPDRSAKRTFYATQVIAALSLAGLAGASLSAASALGLSVLHYAALTFFAAAIGWRLVAAASSAPILSRIAAPKRWPVYTVLCPAYREANVIGDLIASLGALAYPRHALDVKLLVEADDAETTAAALALAGASNIEVVVVPSCAPRTKPKALNVGLARARGEYLVVYDAEDRPHPYQLHAALAAFEDGGARLACVQAPLAIDNPDASWIAGQFAAEYAIQFREVLPLLARFRLPLPLGGSSNHFRTDALRAVGGWDPFNVTEDADLGYRLARDGWLADMIGPPTYEEAPVTFRAWLAQRTRWIKGHMQTWLVLMRDPGRTARDMGFPAFLSMQLTLAGGILAALAHGPLALTLVYAALSPADVLSDADFALALSGYATAGFAALFASGVTGDLNHARALATMPVYWPLQSIAACRALWDLVLRPHHWSKTTHGVSTRPQRMQV